jgi:hypothetical protein
MDLLPVSAVARARHLPVSVRAGAVPRLAKISRAAWRGLSGPGRAAECEQARAVSQQRMRAFPWHLEFLPAALSVGVQRRRLAVLSPVLRQLSAGGDHHMLVEGMHRCQPGGNRAARPGSPAAMATRRMSGRLGLYSGVCRTLGTCSSSVSSVTGRAHPRHRPGPLHRVPGAWLAIAVRRIPVPFSPPARPTRPGRPGRARRAGQTIEPQRRVGRAGTSGPRLYPRR